MKDVNSNPFRAQREKKGLTIAEVARELELPRKTIYALEKGDVESLKFGDVIRAARHLEVNLSRYLLQKYRVKGIYEGEDLKGIVNRLVAAEIDLMFAEIERFAAFTQTRADDFDVKVLLDSGKLYALIVLNNGLKAGKISREEALQEFPPKRPFNRRRRQG